MQRATIRQDANNHLVQGLHSFFAAKTVVYDEEDPSAQAVLSTALTGNNNDIDYTAVPYGAKGNNISIAYVDPEAADAELGIVVTGNIEDGVLITVNLATDETEAITTTADLLKAALDTADVSTYVTYADKAANDGSGVVTALAETALAGGAGHTLFEISGTVGITVMAVADTDLDGDGTLDVGWENSENYFLSAQAVASVDEGAAATEGASFGVGETLPTNLATVKDHDIRDRINTDTISGTITYYAWFYPLSEDSEVTITDD